MNLLRFLIVIRLFAGGIASMLFGVQVAHVALIGFDLISIGFLFALLAYYTTTYIQRFFFFDQNGLLFELDSKESAKFQQNLLILGILFTLYEISTHFKTVDIEFIFLAFAKNVFIIVPERTFSFLIKVYNNLAKKDRNEK